MTFLDFNLQLTHKTLLKWFFLKLISTLFRVLIDIRLFLYLSGVKRSYTPKKNLISVGNITMGGTGKTPMIDWLLRFFENRKLNAAVLTRGYKAERVENNQVLNDKTASQGNPRRFGDEPWMLFKRHPKATFFIGPDRVKSARMAETEADLMLLDDGMQHLRINRNLNIVLIDSLAKIGNGNLFPLGPLREPLTSLGRADVVIYTRTNLASSNEIQKEIKPYLAPATPQFNASYRLNNLISSKLNKSKPPSALSGKQCLLFSGIGNPTSMTMVVQQLGCAVRDHLIFGDHVSYDSSNLQELKHYLNNTFVDFAICSEKDWVKLERFKDLLPEFWYLQMELSVDKEFEEFIARYIKSGIS